MFEYMPFSIFTLHGSQKHVIWNWANRTRKLQFITPKNELGISARMHCPLREWVSSMTQGSRIASQLLAFLTWTLSALIPRATEQAFVIFTLPVLVDFLGFSLLYNHFSLEVQRRQYSDVPELAVYSPLLVCWVKIETRDEVEWWDVITKSKEIGTGCIWLCGVGGAEMQTV